MTLTITLPIRTESEANLREHWAKKSRRAKDQRGTARMILGQWRHSHLKRHAGTFVIKLTRIGQKPLDPDNLANGMKAVQDGIADAIGIDDGDERVRWIYAQEKGKPREYAVRVEINY